MGRIAFLLVLLLATPCWSQQTNKNQEPNSQQVIPPEVPMGSIAYLDARYGFRGHEFNTDRKSMGFTEWNCIHSFDAPTICHFPIEKEDRSFGAAVATSIDYVFHGEGLMGVDL